MIILISSKKDFFFCAICHLYYLMILTLILIKIFEMILFLYFKKKILIYNKSSLSILIGDKKSNDKHQVVNES